MRLGVFMATFGSLLCILAIGMPIPLGPDPIPGGHAPSVGAPPICLAFEHGREELGMSLPGYVRLRPDTLWASAQEQAWFRADGGPEQNLYTYAWWQPAGPDSIDIAWHHSPVLRLATKGDTLRGRGIPSWVAPLITMLQMPGREFPIWAVRVPCDEIVTPAT